MPPSSSKLNWSTVRFDKKAAKWWVKETSDPRHYEPDGLGILDPRQMTWVLDMLDPLREYGLSNEIIEAAFIPFQIQTVDKDELVKLARVAEHLLESEEMLFGLPNVKDGDKGAYADFLEHVMRLRVKFLNDNIKLEQKLTYEDIDEHVGDIRNQALIEGRDIHPLEEITDILDFVPEGHELPVDDEDDDAKPARRRPEDEIEDLPEADEKLSEDETMRWGDEEERGGEGGESSEGGESTGRSRKRR
jgi:hypothetical protein